MKLGSFMIISLLMLSNVLMVSSFIDVEPSTVLSRGPLGAITIGSDTELIDMASERNWTGNGTKDAPIVISNLSIDVFGGYYGLLIANTTLNILIENCSFYNATDGFPHPFPSSGLILHNLGSIMISNSTFEYNTNGITVDTCVDVYIRNSYLYRNLRGVELEDTDGSRIENCTFDQNLRDAIHLEYSDKNLILNNTGYYNGPGIQLDGSHHNRIEGNGLYYTSDEGVRLDGSDYNLITENYIDGFGDGDGITLASLSSMNIVWNNTLKDPEEYGILFISSIKNLIFSNSLINCSLVFKGTEDTYEQNDIGDNNTVNGKPLMILKDMDYNYSMISPVCGQMILVNVTNLKIEDISIDNGTYGLMVLLSDGIIISNSTFKDHIYQGLELISSINVSITNCTLNGNYYSILVEGSENVEVARNEMMDCDRGVELSGSLEVLIRNNSIHDMKDDGISVTRGRDSLCSGNMISHCNSGIAIQMSSTFRMSIINNHIEFCDVGIKHKPTETLVSRNTIVECGLAISVYVFSSINVTICDNLIQSTSGDGIFIDGDKAVIRNNTISSNLGYGIHIEDGVQNVLEKNRMFNCSITFGDFRKRFRAQVIGPYNEVNSLPVLIYKNSDVSYVNVNDDVKYGQVLIYASYVEISNFSISNATVGYYILADSAVIRNSSASGCGIGMEVQGSYRLENCIFQGNGIGLDVRSYPHRDEIIGSAFINNSHGIFNNGESGLVVSVNVFQSNDAGISTFNGGSCIIEGNQFHEGSSYALSLTSGEDVVKNNAFLNNNHMVENSSQVSILEGTDVSGNYWSDHIGPYDFMTGVMEEPHFIDTSPIAYIPREIIIPPRITEFEDESSSILMTFDHPIATEHVIYRSENRVPFEEVSRVTGDQDYYRDYNVSDLHNYSYMVQSLCEIGLTFPSVPTSYFIDRTPPVLDILNPVNGSWFNTDEIFVSWNYSDIGIGGCEVFISINNGIPIDVTGNLSHNITGLGDGFHKVKVIVIDHYRNSMEKEVCFGIDRIRPDMEIVLPREGDLLNASVIEVVGYLLDDHDILRIERHLDGEMILLDSIDHNIPDIEEGCHEMMIRAFDQAGNIAESKVNFTVDLTPPAILEVLPNSSLIGYEVENVTIRFSEDMDLDKMVFTLNGNRVSLMFGSRKTVHISTLLLEGGVPYNLAIEGTDLAGNWLEDARIEFTIEVRLYELECRVRDGSDGSLIRTILNVSIEDIEGSSMKVENGTIVMYLPLGHYALIIFGEGYQDLRFEFDLNGDLEFEVDMERVEERGPEKEDGDEPYLLILVFVVTILLIMFFYIVPAKLSKKYSEEE